MRSALILVALLSSTAHADVRGCWDVGAKGARLVLAGDRGTLQYRATFPDRPRGGPAEMKGDAVRAGDEVEVMCRPMSQHGSFCRVRREGDGLRVRVFARGHGNQKRGRLVESFVAPRCQ